MDNVDFTGHAPPASYVITGVRTCATWHSSLPFSITPSHYFLDVGGDAFGFYQKQDSAFGEGQILDNEFLMSPENTPNAAGIYSTCSNLWIDGECYNVAKFRNAILSYKAQSMANPPYYVIGVMDCFEWRLDAVAQALVAARERNPKNARTFCKCAYRYTGDIHHVVEWL